MLHQSELSEEEKKNNEELNFVFELLANVIAPEKTNSSNKFVLRINLLDIPSKIASTLWEQVFFIWFIAFTLAATGERVNSKTTQPTANITYLLIIGMTSFWLYIISKFIRNIKQQESSEQIIRRRIEATKQETLSDKQIIKELSEKVKQENLKIAEEEFKLLIEKTQFEIETSSALSPILSIFSVGITIFILGIPVQLESTLFYVAVTAIIGIVLKPIFDFIVKSVSPTRIIKFKKCLFLLEQAQLIANNIEDNQNVVILKHYD